LAGIAGIVGALATKLALTVGFLPK
jgi:hypothetical protein